MRIIVVSQIYHPTPFRINDIVAALIDAGHEVKVITGLPDYGLKKIPQAYRWGRRRREWIDGAEVVRVPTTARRTGVFWRALNYASFAVSGWLYACFCKKDFDIILNYETSPIFQAIPARRLKHRSKKPFVLYCLDLWPESLKAWQIKEEDWLFKISAKISAKLYRSADCVPISSPAFRSYLETHSGVPSQRIVFWPQHGETHFAAIDGTVTQTGFFDFVYAGNMGSVQAVDQFLYAIPYMQAKRPYRFHFVGGGSELTNLKSLATALSINDRVIFYDQKPASEMPYFYKLADVFLLSLASDSAIALTLPGKLQGYMGAGKPIAAVAGGAVSDLIKKVECGVVSTTDKPKQTAAQLDYLIENERARWEMGRNGQKFYNNYFTKTAVMDKILTTLNQLMNNNETPYSYIYEKE
ncbi:MAG TPA: glycosyltransferase family 4 protein [Clostridiaceae bacterium]|nr:glycosyltransferase family 4 protein [Clostridiaceae bacterium]